MGWPLLAPGVHVAGTVGQIRPWTPAAEGVDWTSVGEPVAGAVEWVIVHDARPGDDGWAAMGVVNDAGPRGEPVSVVVEWDIATLPRLVQWTMTGESMYVVGVEPANVGLGGRAELDESGHPRAAAGGGGPLRRGHHAQLGHRRPGNGTAAARRPWRRAPVTRFSDLGSRPQPVC